MPTGCLFVNTLCVWPAYLADFLCGADHLSALLELLDNMIYSHVDTPVLHTHTHTHTHMRAHTHTHAHTRQARA